MRERRADSQPSSRADFATAPASRRPSGKAPRKWRRRTIASCVALPVLLATTGFGGDESSSHHGGDSGPASEPTLSFIEMPQGPPEDIIALPGTRWVVTSSMGSAAHPGGLSLVNSRSEEVTALWPVEGDFTYAYDATAFPGCGGPPDEANAVTHGINIRQTGRWTFDLYVVYHGGRESIEVFSLDVRGDRPTASWRGCVEAYPGTAGNSVAALPDGGIAMTNPYDITQPILEQLLSGEHIGDVWTWHRDSGWTKVPGSDMYFPNGIEVSDDGATLYVAQTSPAAMNVVAIPTAGGEQAVLGQTELDPDNLRWTDSGTLLTTGSMYQGEPTLEVVAECATGLEAEDFCIRGFDIAEIDPATGTSEVVFSTRTPEIVSPTVAAPVGCDIWVGNLASARIAVVSGLHHGGHGGAVGMADG